MDVDTFLAHHGVKGQKWGVSTKPDGTKVGKPTKEQKKDIVRVVREERENFARGANAAAKLTREAGGNRINIQDFYDRKIREYRLGSEGQIRRPLRTYAPHHTGRLARMEAFMNTQMGNTKKFKEYERAIYRLDSRQLPINKKRDVQWAIKQREFLQKHKSDTMGEAKTYLDSLG